MTEMFRDWLRTHPDDRDRYAAAKRGAAAAGKPAAGEPFAYDECKRPVIREIMDRMFDAYEL